MAWLVRSLRASAHIERLVPDPPDRLGQRRTRGDACHLWNPAFERCFSTKPDEIEGKNLETLVWPSGGSRSRSSRAASYSWGICPPDDARGRRKDRTMVEPQFQRVPDGSQRPVHGVLGTVPRHIGAWASQARPGSCPRKSSRSCFSSRRPLWRRVSTSPDNRSDRRQQTPGSEPDAGTCARRGARSGRTPVDALAGSASLISAASTSSAGRA